MNRWILLLLTLCLLLAPAASAEGHEPNGNGYGHEENPAGDGESADAEAHSTSDEQEVGSDDAEGNSTLDGSGPVQIGQDRCILYEWAGGVEDVRIAITPILGILVLSPMDCVEEIIDPEELQLDP